MISAPYPFASLGPRLVRTSRSSWEMPVAPARLPASSLNEDLRFFALSWAAGFLFFLAYLA